MALSLGGREAGSSGLCGVVMEPQTSWGESVLDEQIRWIHEPNLAKQSANTVPLLLSTLLILEAGTTLVAHGA